MNLLTLEVDEIDATILTPHSRVDAKGNSTPLTPEEFSEAHDRRVGKTVFRVSLTRGGDMIQFQGPASTPGERERAIKEVLLLALNDVVRCMMAKNR